MKRQQPIVYIVVVITFLFFLWLYLTLLTKSQIVNSNEPYSLILNKELYLEREVLLIKNVKPEALVHIHKIVEKDTRLYEGVTVVQKLKKGTPMMFHQAKLFTNRVSGTTTSVLLGTVYLENQELPFEHYWGTKTYLLDKNKKDYWTFVKPIWDGKVFNQHYYLD